MPVHSNALSLGVLRRFTLILILLGIRSITAEDYAIIQLYLSGGCCVTISINSVMSGFSQDIVVCGDAGYLAFTSDTLKGRKNGASKDQLIHLDSSQSDSDLSNSGLPTIHSIGMVRMIKALRDCFQARAEGREVDTGAASFSDGLYVQAVMEALRRSSETRQWRKVEMYDEDGSGPIQI